MSKHVPMNGVTDGLYREIYEGCNDRCAKTGEEYECHIWFEEAEKVLEKYKNEGLTETVKEIEKMIATNRQFV